MPVWAWIGIGFAVVVVALIVGVIRFAQTHGDEIGVLREGDYARGGIVPGNGEGWAEKAPKGPPEQIIPLRAIRRYGPRG